MMLNAFCVPGLTCLGSIVPAALAVGYPERPVRLSLLLKLESRVQTVSPHSGSRVAPCMLGVARDRRTNTWV